MQTQPRADPGYTTEFPLSTVVPSDQLDSRQNEKDSELVILRGDPLDGAKHG